VSAVGREYPTMRIRRVGLGLAPLLWAGAALGADGVIEINQAKALAGGVTSADAPGFPVTLVPDTSYVLTSDLVVTNDSNHAIDDVGAGGFGASGTIHVDLNGFSIRCDNPVPNCGGGFGIGGGIFFDNVRSASIENGSVHHLRGSGIEVRTRGARIDRVHAYSNGATGISCGTSCMVTNSTSNENGTGIVVESRSTVLGCIAEANLSHGISVGRDSNVRDSTSVGNGGNGINLANLGPAPFGYGGNVIVGNGGTVAASGVQTGTNLCDTDTICP